MLGTNTWRIEAIEADRVIVAPGRGAPAMMPFWRGEGAGRSSDLGQADRRASCASWPSASTTPTASTGCRASTASTATPPAACATTSRRQLLAAGCLPTTGRSSIEASRDPLGDWQVILLSPLGGRLHLALRLALEARLRQRLGYRPQCLHHDDGVLDPPDRHATSRSSTCFDGLTPENVEELILDELADSALFAPALPPERGAGPADAARPGRASGRPLWLQRLRGRDLLQVARELSLKVAADVRRL